MSLLYDLEPPSGCILDKFATTLTFPDFWVQAVSNIWSSILEARSKGPNIQRSSIYHTSVVKMAILGSLTGSEETKSLYEPRLDTTVNTIRLLTISWEKSGSTWSYSGKLHPHILSPDLKYNCVSYVWGKQVSPPKHTILLNGLPRRLLPSIYSILELIREEFSNDLHRVGTSSVPSTKTATSSSITQSPTYWWIDFLCINQEDDEEKTSQVAIMKEIYKGAQETVVWLGEEVDGLLDMDMDVRNCTGGIESLRKLLGQRYRFYGRTGNGERDREIGMAKMVGYRDSLGVDWIAIERVLLRPWWRRVWTLQEFAIAENVTIYCGHTKITRKDWHNAIDTIYMCKGADQEFMRAAYDAGWNRRRITQWNYSYPEKMSLVALIAYVGQCNTTDERDRIYSLLGLARDSDMVGCPDYNATVEEVYTNLVHSFIKKYNSLDIICFAHYFRNRNSKLPSWVPDWRVKIETKVVPLMVSQASKGHIGNFRPPRKIEEEIWGIDSYNACGNHKVDLRRSGTLQPIFNGLVTGLKIDCIDGKFTNTTYEKFLEAPLVRSRQRFNLPSSSITNTGVCLGNENDLLEVISQCLVLEREDPYLNYRTSRGHFRRDFLAFCKAASDPTMRKDVHPLFLDWFIGNRDLFMQGQTLETLSQEVNVGLEQPPINLRNASDFMDLSHTCDNSFLARFRDTTAIMERRLVVTDRGYVGMAPSHAERGDVICVILGFSVPVVLRRRDSTNKAGEAKQLKKSWTETYEFIGECYLHGFMDGEVLDEENSHWKFERRNFQLV